MAQFCTIHLVFNRSYFEEVMIEKPSRNQTSNRA